MYVFNYIYFEKTINFNSSLLANKEQTVNIIYKFQMLAMNLKCLFIQHKVLVPATNFPRAISICISVNLTQKLKSLSILSVCCWEQLWENTYDKATLRVRQLVA